MNRQDRRSITILGSTGSIGTQTLDIARAYPERLRVVALAARRNVALLEQQTREFEPQLVAVYDEEAAADLRLRIRDLPVRVVSGMEGLIEACTLAQAQMVVTGIVGMIGIRPTVAAIESGKDIALANKETLVTAGHLIMPLARRQQVRILPVDSEHSAIFQCLQGEDRGALDRILLTASGGPFRGKKRSELEQVTAADALKHPNWDMGAKVTIDSSTMVNKGLEVMEAAWLFGVAPDQIQVVVQPQSIVHSMVQFRDGAVIAQLGVPDMRLPIRYALFYGQDETDRGTRLPLEPERVDFWQLGELRFEQPDTETFRGLPLAYAAAAAGGSMPTVFNAANEVAVQRFLKGEISYLGIYDMIEGAMAAHRTIQNPDIGEILAVEQEVRRTC
ncbi:MAG: 1-deoxy-D-xylulose-5-phosphate reductoisomerase [Butyrivibrio sp.]|nr:1-deoxy-D-xylulose-5-phosphate reductoisomerase [Butyrivibrio sp.]